MATYYTSAKAGSFKLAGVVILQILQRPSSSRTALKLVPLHVDAVFLSIRVVNESVRNEYALTRSPAELETPGALSRSTIIIALPRSSAEPQYMLGALLLACLPSAIALTATNVMYDQTIVQTQSATDFLVRDRAANGVSQFD